MAEREIEKWITVNGRHVPVYKGESSQDAVNRSIAQQNEDKKDKDIAKAKEQADKLNGKKTDYENWRDDLVKDILKDAKRDTKPDELLSNSDIQSIVEAYTLEHGGDDDEIIEDIRDAVDKALKPKMEESLGTYRFTPMRKSDPGKSKSQYKASVSTNGSSTKTLPSGEFDERKKDKSFRIDNYWK